MTGNITFTFGEQAHVLYDSIAPWIHMAQRRSWARASAARQAVELLPQLAA